MSDTFLAFYKVGDLPGKETMRDGALITYIDPDQWDPVISEYMKKVYCIIRHKKTDWLDMCKASINPLEDSDGNLLHERAFAIDFDEIETALKLKSYTSKLRSGEVQEIIDGTSLSNSFLRDVTKIKKRGLFDLNSVSSGSFTVGSAGNYTTLALASADMISLTGNLTFTQISDIIDAAGFNTFAQNVGSNTLTITSDTKPNGDPTAGHVWTWGGVGGAIGMHFRLLTNADGIINLDGIHMDCVGAGTTSQSIRLANTFTTVGTLNVKGIMLDGAGASNRGIDIRDNTSKIQVWNNKIFNYKGLGSGTGIIIATLGLHANSRIENNSVDNCKASNLVPMFFSNNSTISPCPINLPSNKYNLSPYLLHLA